MKNKTSKSLFTSQHLKFIFLNLSVFLLIFAIFGAIAIGIITDNFTRNADQVLERIAGELSENPSRPPQIKEEPLDNPRIIYIYYNDNREIIYYRGFFNQEDLPAISDNFNQIETTQIAGFLYRKIDLNVSGYIINRSNNQILEVSYQYVQVLINIDGEMALRDNIATIYLICLGIILVLVIIASIVLSNFTMKPIEKLLSEQIRFVADASHELRSPLTIIQNELEQMLTRPESNITEESENIAICLSEVNRLRKLTSDLLMLAKGDAFKMELELSQFDIGKLIEKISEPYMEMASLSNKMLELDLDYFLVEADYHKIIQVLVITLDNALKFTNANDYITISCRTINNRYQLTITDTGYGITDDAKKQVFNRFYRESQARETGGNGLGLSIAKWIVDKHQGKIIVLDNIPRGTKIAITLPLKQIKKGKKI